MGHVCLCFMIHDCNFRLLFRPQTALFAAALQCIFETALMKQVFLA